MKEIKTVKINSEDCDYAQRLSYEINGYKSLMRSILQCNNYQYDEKLYEKYMKEYQNVNAEFEYVVTLMKQKYANELPSGVYTTINFLESTIVFSLDEHNHKCSKCN